MLDLHGLGLERSPDELRLGGKRERPLVGVFRDFDFGTTFHGRGLTTEPACPSVVAAPHLVSIHVGAPNPA
jgi:hypothetical protein